VKWKMIVLVRWVMKGSTSIEKLWILRCSLLMSQSQSVDPNTNPSQYLGLEVDAFRSRTW